MEIYKVTVDNYGTICWYNENNQLHRLDGPAVEWGNRSKQWYRHGLLHREDGPAVEWGNGHKEYYINGNRHREDGPAVDYCNGRKEYWINGVRLTEEEFVNYNKKIQVYKVIVDDNGITRWYNEEGKLQRIEGPPGPLYEYSKKMTIAEI